METTLPAAGLERLPPHNLDAEQSLLGSLLIDRDAIIRVAAFVKPEDFYAPANGTVYRAVLDLYNRREPTDVVTLTDELGRRDQLEAVGGAAYLSALVSAVPTAVHVEYYGRIVERTATLRRLIDAGTQIVTIGYRDGVETEDALDAAERAVFEVSQKRQTKDFVAVADVLDRFFDQIDYLQQHRGEVVGVGTGFADLDQLLGGLQRSDLVIVAARPSMGKCLTADTLVVDPATGERLTIAACVARRLPTVLGLDDQGRVRPTPVGDWVDSGTKPCLRVTTRSGRQVETTYHHPFLTADGWQPVVELRVGDRIAVPKVVPVFGRETPPVWLPRLLAYFVAEGGLTGTTPPFSNADPEIVDDFRQIVHEQFPGLRLRQDRVTSAAGRPDWRGKAEPNPVTALLREHGLWGKGAAAKRFPAEVWRWERSALASFLRVLFSCDGTVYPMAGYPRIEFTVASPGLAEDVQHALLRFGIVAKRWQKTERSWRVEITAPDAVDRYHAEVGWVGEKRCRVFVRRPGRRSNLGHPPVEVWGRVVAGCREQGLNLTELGRRAGYPSTNPHLRRSLPAPRLAAYARVLDDPELGRVASADIHWDEIVAIEEIGEQRVYDLTVPDGANFVANDVVVHNTSLALGLAHGAAIAHGKTVGVFSLEMSAEQLVQRLLAMETGVDAHRLRLGQIDDTEWDRISRAFGRLAEARVFIDDQAAASVMDVRSKARRLQAEHGLDLLVVDYLQLMTGRRSENRVQEISEISRGLKGLARELNIPVVALSQLSRAVETRADHRPMLSDLRESGCLAGDTPVFLPATGGTVPIRDLAGRSGFDVLALNPLTWRLERRHVLRAFSTGAKPVFRLRTRLGRTIRATANHQFLAFDGWRRLDALGVGTRIALPRRLPPATTADDPMSPDHLALLGHLIGDGCTLPRHAIQYTTNDPVLAETVAHLAARCFGSAVTPRVVRQRDWLQVFLAAAEPLTHGRRNPVSAWLDGLGAFNKRSWEKRVPDRVFRQTDAAIALFLRHLWSTDGCVHQSGKTGASSVYYATTSEGLAFDVQSLLLRLGVNATLRVVPQAGSARRGYQVWVSGAEEITRFLDVVGAIGTQKTAQARRMHPVVAARAANTNRDTIPREARSAIVQPAMAEAGITARDMHAAIGSQYCGSSLYRSNLGRERAGRVAQAVSSERLMALATSDVYWDEVAAIEPDGEEEVFDLTVEDLHNFVAGDIVVHNSIEQDADVVLFIYREDKYEEDSDKRGIAEIIVAKHRNGPVGSVNLRFFERTARFADLEVYRGADG